MKILVMNAGSSSQKSRFYDLSGGSLPKTPPEPLWDAQIDWTKSDDGAELKVETAHGATLTKTLQPDSKPAGIADMLRTLWSGDTQVIDHPDQVDVVGHRVVHGGQTYQDSVFISSEVKQAIADLIPLAPAHNPANLEGVEAIERAIGSDISQVAVFDTAFHSRMPLTAAVYPGPYDWLDQGIRRYGFHGINHQYCAHRAAQILSTDLNQLRLLTCHLGNGCSLAAIRDGHSIDTTMGYTPLEGLMMGSRSGSVDPGILIHLIRDRGYSPDEVDQMLNKQSGLKGISGISNDLRQIGKAIAQGNDRARLAFDLFIHRLQKEMGAMIASLGGLDAIIFSAGIGEHAPDVRERACDAFRFLGLALDPEKNDATAHDVDIATAGSPVRVLVITAEEDWAIAQECWRLMQP
ncbi:MAG: acetate kinase [Synechococcales bacterium]|nr:acetate kinase [Synechococcales bacterium]